MNFVSQPLSGRTADSIRFTAVVKARIRASGRANVSGSRRSPKEKVKACLPQCRTLVVFRNLAHSWRSRKKGTLEDLVSQATRASWHKAVCRAPFLSRVVFPFGSMKKGTAHAVLGKRNAVLARQNKAIGEQHVHPAQESLETLLHSANVRVVVVR